jgi:hypothetical protein
LAAEAIMRFRLRAGAKVLFIAAMFAALLAGDASAQGLLDFLFGRPPERSSPPPPSPLPQQYPSRPSPQSGGQSAPAPRNFDQPIGNSNTGRSTAYCVRMCDGRYFPLERFSTVTPTQMCNSLCPASPTKVYNGGEIAGAVATDGERYAGLKTAYLYRKQIVPNCTCNGRDIFGLASIDVKTDPTLRAGDTVSTGDGVIVVTRPPRVQSQAQ